MDNLILVINRSLFREEVSSPLQEEQKRASVLPGLSSDLIQGSYDKCRVRQPWFIFRENSEFSSFRIARERFSCCWRDQISHLSQRLRSGSL